MTTVGRHPDVTVPRRHHGVADVTPCSTPTPGRHQVRDVGSLNGTYVNRARIEEAGWTSGDEVQIGKFKLVFMALGSATE